MDKKGGVEMSFGMIFSIVIIIAILGIGFYVVSKFINLSRCTEVALFYDDLQKRVDKAWASGITQDVFTGSLPGGIDEVCFGSLNSSFKGYEEEHEFLSKYKRLGKNIFLYPTKNACDSNLAHHNIKNVETLNKDFFCIPTENGKVSVKISKGSFDALVKLAK